MPIDQRYKRLIEELWKVKDKCSEWERKEFLPSIREFKHHLSERQRMVLDRMEKQRIEAFLKSLTGEYRGQLLH